MRFSFFALFALMVTSTSYATDPAPSSKSSPQLIGSSVFPAPEWKQLTPEQKEALSPLASSFDQFSPAQRRKWVAISQQYYTLTPEKQQLMQKNMALWAHMTPEQRAAVRQQSVSPSGDRSQSWEQWKKMDPEQQRALHQKSLQRSGSPLPSPASTPSQASPVSPS